MRHSRTEVARWRMMRQAIRKRRRWLEGQSRRNFRIYKLRKLDTSRKHRALFICTTHRMELIISLLTVNINHFAKPY